MEDGLVRPRSFNRQMFISIQPSEFAGKTISCVTWLHDSLNFFIKKCFRE